MNLFAFTTPTAANNTGATRVRRWAGAGLLACAALGAGAAQAADVYWNIGVQAPGAMIELANAPRVVYGPAPVMMVPAPVYGTAWVPVYPERREYRHRHHHHGHDRDWDHGRYERSERYEGDGRRWR